MKKSKLKDEIQELNMQDLLLLESTDHFKKKIGKIREIVGIYQPELFFSPNVFKTKEGLFAAEVVARVIKLPSFPELKKSIDKLITDYQLPESYFPSILCYVVTGVFSYANATFSAGAVEENCKTKYVEVRFHRKPSTKDWKLLKTSLNTKYWLNDKDTKGTPARKSPELKRAILAANERRQLKEEGFPLSYKSLAIHLLELEGFEEVDIDALTSDEISRLGEQVKKLIHRLKKEQQKFD